VEETPRPGARNACGGDRATAGSSQATPPIGSQVPSAVRTREYIL
jgi:hypothetical protein